MTPTLHMADVALLCSLLRGRVVYEKHWETLRFWCAGCSLTVHVVQDFLKEEDKNENETFLQDCLQKWSSKLHNVQKKQFRETFARSTPLRKRFLHVIPHSAYFSLPVPDFFTQRKITMWKPTNVQDFFQKRTTATASAISATATTAGAGTATVLLLLLSWFLNPATQSFPTKLPLIMLYHFMVQLYPKKPNKTLTQYK